jgi:hypothetical protein
LKDKACESNSDKSSDGEYETDEEWETERKKQAAVLEKDKVICPKIIFNKLFLL